MVEIVHSNPNLKKLGVSVSDAGDTLIALSASNLNDASLEDLTLWGEPFEGDSADVEPYEQELVGLCRLLSMKLPQFRAFRYYYSPVKPTARDVGENFIEWRR